MNQHIVLQSPITPCNMTLEGIADLYEQMKLEKLLSQHCDLGKIKYRKEINQYISSEDNVGGAYTLGDMLNDQKNN